MRDTITLQLDVFEGPFDLLLYLIKKNDLEISKISLSQVTDQYLKYLEALKELNIDLASDFLYMAAELAHIKSRTLLPNENKILEEEEDSAADDIISKLREYERYKMAAEDLKKRSWLHRDIFTRGSFVAEEDEKEPENKPESLENYDVDSMELIRVFSELLDKLPKEKIDHHVAVERVSVTDRLYEILDCLKIQESILFTELFEESRTRMDIVVTLLAVLEMCRLRMARVYQSKMFEAIRVQRIMEISEELIEKKDILQSEETYK